MKNDADLADLLNRKIYKKFSGYDILSMTHEDLMVSDSEFDDNSALSLIKNCDFSLLLNSNLEFYFSA